MRKHEQLATSLYGLRFAMSDRIRELESKPIVAQSAFVPLKVYF
jgi:hypothetical protein